MAHNYNYLFVHAWAGVPPALSFPTGLAYTAASLRSAGYNVSGISLDWHKEQQMDILLLKMECDNINCLCIGGMSSDFPVVREIISNVRKNFPRVKIIVGGYIVTSEPEFIVQHLDMDFGCVGYGEETICELAECLESDGDFSKVKGLIYKNDSGEFVINPKRPDFKSLDDLPFPALELFGFSGGDFPLTMYGSRSCINNCTFCCRGEYKYSERSLDNIFSEIDYWREKFPISSIIFRDELFAKDKERFFEFCRRIKEYNLTFRASLRADVVTEEIIRVLADSGCNAILYGIESMNQSVLDSMRKKITVEQIEYALAITRKYNIMTGGIIIFGDPVETYEMARQSLDWSIRSTDSVFCTMIKAYPGSELYEIAVKTGRINDKLNFLERGCPPVNISLMSDAEYDEIQSRAEKAGITIANRFVMNLRFETGAGNDVLIYGYCPYCGAENYTNFDETSFDIYIEFYNKNCVECNGKLKYASEHNNNYFERRYFNEFTYEGKRVAVWGLSEKAKFRIATNKTMREAITMIVDLNYNLYKDNFLGIEVRSPVSITKADFDVLYVGSEVWREQILHMALEFLGDGFFKKEIMIAS